MLLKSGFVAFLSLAVLGGIVSAQQGLSPTRVLDRLNSSDSSDRLAASVVLQAMETRAVPALMDRLNLVAPLYLAEKSDGSYGPFIADITNVLLKIVENSERNQSKTLIQSTRTCEFIANLARLAGSGDRSIRIPASNLLWIVVDTTTVGLVANFILPMLKANNINGTINLLQAVQVMSSTITRDTKDKLEPVVRNIDAYLGSSSLEVGKSPQLLQDIKARLANNQVPDPAGGANPVASCNPDSFSLNATVKPKIAYIHTASSAVSADTRVALQNAVQSYGIKVGGFDSDVDSVGGIGIDYFDDADRPVAQQLADSIGGFLNIRTPFTPRKQLSKLNPQGVFGIWLPPPTP